MAKFELPIYGENDELIKTYGTDHVRWKLFIRAAEIQENQKLNGDDVADKIIQVSDLLKNVFCGITDKELENADVVDIFNTFEQITNIGNSIKGGKAKN
jgi:hypothetical protein